MKLIPRSNSFFIDNVFSDLITNESFYEGKCDIYEENDKYYIELDIPGYSREDTKIEYDNGYLTVTASKNNEASDEVRNYIRRERSFNKISRSFYVGVVEEKNIKANFKNGSLTIEVPKEDKQNNKKTILIEEN